MRGDRHCRQLKGQIPAGFIVLNSGVDAPRRSREGSGQAGARQDRPGAASRHVMVVKRLPKTRSGKILRGTMLHRRRGGWKMPATIDDPAILDEMAKRGITGKSD
jgi:propionyl-CoA synthetase